MGNVQAREWMGTYVSGQGGECVSERVSKCVDGEVSDFVNE